MSALLLVLLIGAPPSADSAAPAADLPSSRVEQPPPKFRSGHELRLAVHDALRRWARTPDDQAEPAAREFLRLYGELAADGQMAEAGRIELALKVRGRLADLSRQLTAKVSVPAPDAAGGEPAAVVPPLNPPLAQLAPARAMRANAARPVRARSAGLELAGDAGEDLVDLIQKTIAPHTWDVNGGPGTIRYWRSGRALVVRQTDEAHRALGNLVEQLEKAGR